MNFFQHLLGVNWVYITLVVLLALAGYVALFSVAGGAAYPFAEPQALRFGFGLFLMTAIALSPIRLVYHMAGIVYASSILLLGMVLAMGHIGKGAERWINLLGFQFQPSEIAKIALVLGLAAFFAHPSVKNLKTPLKWVVPVLMVLLPVILVLKEPNLGTAVIIGVIGGSLFFCSGFPLWIIGVAAAFFPLLGKILYNHLYDYQKARIDTFLHPEHDRLGAGYNILQSRIALGSGGIWGKGYLHGTQGQLNFLPEKQTDFIFTIIGEEWGFVGAISIIVLLAMLTIMGMVMGILCKNTFSRLLCLGISMDFFLYCAVNLSMVMGAIPVGGVPLPLISYGGSATLTMMVGFGILLCAWRNRFQEEI
ncbi:rod shape-determining protein RodA [Acetobacteraceae bacterium]|nr:rod shape-determining protein RodA [Acetobacteraceae bacterium]